MATRKRYVKQRPDRVVAVRLDLETEGFTYRKWGHEQRCKAGDWLVTCDGDTRTVDAQSFANTYRLVALGQYAKVGAVWAEQATEGGAVQTKEGLSAYAPGDYIVSNCPDGSDAYAVQRECFEATYALADDEGAPEPAP